MGRLVTIELENFKSYAGYQSIGPFKSFQAVIGPNGSGKSNLMDAISFVLGVKSKHLRSHKLGDLVFRADGKAPPKRRASVKLVYQVDANEVDEMQAGDEIHFMRTIAVNGVGSYRINDLEVTWDSYDKKLREIGVLTKARNFLVFQGDVESVASKSPKELTTLIEQISGSEDYREQYEELKKLKDQAEENTIFMQQKKKGYMVEKKQVREQKEEAERFNEKTMLLIDLKREYFLFQLFHIHKDINAHQNAIDEFEETKEEVQSREAASEDHLKASKKSFAKLNQALSAAEKAVQQHKVEIEKAEPQQLKLVAEFKSLQKKIAEDERTSEIVRKDDQELSERIEGITEDIGALEDEERGLDESVSNAREKSGVELDDDKRVEYETLKAEVQKRTAADRSELESISRQQKSDESSFSRLEVELNELTSTSESDKERHLKLKERWASIHQAAEDARSQARDVERELQEIESKEVDNNRSRKELESELDQVQAQLREVKDDHHQSKNEEKMAECLETLKRLFPGVRGRLIDLCKPAQRKYDTAVTVAAGRHMDAIVVDTQQTGYECMLYLREHRIGVASFIPLNGIKIKEINERLRVGLGPNTKLCIDLIQCASDIRPAVQYAVENTVVCETLSDARDLCFRRGENVKAVTLDGSVISKAGTMTGGNSARDASGSSRWDGQVHADLKKRRDKLIQEVNKLETAHRDNELVSELKTKITQLKSKEQYAVKDLQITNEKMVAIQKQAQELKKQIAHVNQEKQKVLPMISDRENSIRAIQSRVAAHEDEIYNAFSRSIGVMNIREFEEGHLRVLQETSENRRKVREQKAKLEAQLQFEKTKDFGTPLEKISKRLVQTKARLAQCDEAAKSLSQEEKSRRTRLRSAEGDRDEAKRSLEEKEIEVKTLQNERGECAKERNALAKKITAEETSIEQLRGTLHSVLQKAKVEEVNLPMVGGGEVAGSETASQHSEGTASTHFSQKDNAQVRYDLTEAERIDFSDLKRHREAQPKQLDGIRTDYDAKISALQTDIHTMQPNMKASEKFDDVSSRLKSSADEFDSAREEAQSATEKFNDVKQRRHDTFMACFSHISDELQSIYRDLTKSSKHPLGGNAFLSLDDSDVGTVSTKEPYLSGIKYNAMPPMKRFRDMDQLSGGEKTVAALAFLFAIHSFRPAPFFVMDEVDAALDNVNVKKVCNYIKHRSKDFQCIVISLKDIFYEQADSLVGICRDFDE